MSDCSTRAWNVWARRPDLHTSPDIGWSRCDNCPELTVKPREWARHERYGYYCDALKKSLTIKEIHEMTKQECPKHVDMRKRARK